MGLLQPGLFHKYFEASGVVLGELPNFASELVLLLDEVVGERAGVLPVTPFDVVGNVPFVSELCRDGLCLVVNPRHSRGRIALEDDIPLLAVVAIADDHGLLFLVSPVGLDLVVEVGRDDVLPADLTACFGVGFESLPDSLGVGVEVVGFG